MKDKKLGFIIVLIVALLAAAYFAYKKYIGIAIAIVGVVIFVKIFKMLSQKTQ